MIPSFGTIAAHRFGLGPRPGEPPAEDVDALMAQVQRGVAETCPFPYDGIDGRRASFAQFRTLFRANQDAKKNGTVRKVGDRTVNPYEIGLTAASLRDQHLKIRHAVESPNGFFERLASFWCGHFAISAGKSSAMRVLVGLYEAEALRPNLAGSFKQLLTAATLHPAMLIYLDQTKSVGPGSAYGVKKGLGLNENLARELIELHTLGAGSGYTQDDVRAAACVLTGLDSESWKFRMAYHQDRAEPGIHRVLGTDYGGPVRRLEDVKALLSDLAGKEATRRHICRKLVVHFIADDPPTEVVEAMVAAWSESDGNLPDVYRAMLEHPRSWEQEGQKARQPYEFVVAGLRALNVPGDALAPVRVADVQSMVAAGAETGTMAEPAQPAMAKPVAGNDMDMTGVSGAGVERNTPAAMSETGGVGLVAAPTADGRIPFRANPYSVGALSRFGQPMWKPASPAGWDENLASWITASQLTERIAWSRTLVARFGEGQDPRGLLQATLGDLARDDTIQSVARAPSREIGLAMVLASPEFNRR
ncbi:DUF1800 domain-containing protein [Mycoplana rhizolycopersici]|uniref:DUF1800 domain-containing protein n=1 Tax=Mycoplana rhizolycopersici TaxID=2746702 RepID=A0ABX2QNK0_9HYPH|nr:DUF1800 domain-containing protein [Rhizobium rhizolycopersici]NVP57916.1 DUF1800 domain-containing protein [Rhizobium rhizolycopersici]